MRASECQQNPFSTATPYSSFSIVPEDIPHFLGGSSVLVGFWGRSGRENRLKLVCKISLLHVKALSDFFLTPPSPPPPGHLFAHTEATLLHSWGEVRWKLVAHEYWLFRCVAEITIVAVSNIHEFILFLALMNADVAMIFIHRTSVVVQHRNQPHILLWLIGSARLPDKN